MAIWRKVVAVLPRHSLHPEGAWKIKLRRLTGRLLWTACGFGDQILVTSAPHPTGCIQPVYPGNASGHGRFCMRRKKLHFIH